MTTESKLIKNRSETKRVMARWEMGGRSQPASWALIFGFSISFQN